MLPVTSLQVGSLYELALAGRGYHYLGCYEGHKEEPSLFDIPAAAKIGEFTLKHGGVGIRANSVFFTIYACQIDFFDFFGKCMARFSIPRLNIIRHVMPSELPLYISWLWHSPKFMDYIRAGV